METANILQAIFSLILVISLIGISSILYKKYVLDKNLMKGGKPRRMVIEEQLYIDSRRRLILVKKDNKEFLLLIGQNGETIINSENIVSHDAELPIVALPKRRLSIKNVYSSKKS